MLVDDINFIWLRRCWVRELNREYKYRDGFIENSESYGKLNSTQFTCTHYQFVQDIDPCTSQFSFRVCRLFLRKASQISDNVIAEGSKFVFHNISLRISLAYFATHDVQCPRSHLFKRVRIRRRW